MEADVIGRRGGTGPSLSCDTGVTMKADLPLQEPGLTCRFLVSPLTGYIGRSKPDRAALRLGIVQSGREASKAQFHNMHNATRVLSYFRCQKQRRWHCGDDLGVPHAAFQYSLDENHVLQLLMEGFQHSASSFSPDLAQLTPACSGNVTFPQKCQYDPGRSRARAGSAFVQRAFSLQAG